MDTPILLKVLSFIAVFLSVLYAVYVIAKKRMIHGKDNRSLIHVVEQKRLEHNVVISVVKIRQEEFILASSAQGLALTKFNSQAITKVME